MPQIFCLFRSINPNEKLSFSTGYGSGGLSLGAIENNTKVQEESLASRRTMGRQCWHEQRRPNERVDLVSPEQGSREELIDQEEAA